MYYSKVVNIIANTECQHSQNNAAGLYVSLSLQSNQSPDEHVMGDLCVGLCFGMHYFVSFLFL